MMLKGRAYKTYIFPNWYGLAGLGLFFICIVAGATFQNNLIFIMGFLVLAMGHVIIVQTARNLKDIEVTALKIDSSFASGFAEAQIFLKNHSRQEFKGAITFDILLEGKPHQRVANVDFSPGESKSVKTSFPLPSKRGRYEVKRVKLHTSYPYSLFQSWSFNNLNSEFFAYPEPKGSQHLPSVRTQSGEEFSGHREFLPGDSIRRVDWKKSSKSQKLLVREFKGDGTGQVWLILEDSNVLGLEDRLSQLSLWAQIAEDSDLRYGLQAKGVLIPPSNGQDHYRRCMEALAEYAA